MACLMMLLLRIEFDLYQVYSLSDSRQLDGVLKFFESCEIYHSIDECNITSYLKFGVFCITFIF